MIRSQPATQPPANTVTAAPMSATASFLQGLAPFITVAALAYPVLVWPLLEAQVVSLDPVYGQPAVDGPPSALLRVYFSTLLVLAITALGVQLGRRPLGLARPLLLALAAYIAWAGVTGFWAVEPEISSRRFLLAVFINGAIVAATLATADIERLLRIAFWMFAIMVALSIVSVLTTKPTALGHAAFYPHKNFFALITAIMSLFALHQLGSGTRLTRPVAVSMLLAAAWFLVEARSKTNLALFVLAPLVAYSTILLTRLTRISPAIILGAFALTLYGIYQFGAQSGFWDFHAAAQALFGDPTLTQRTDIWNFAMRKIAERPWLGYGYEVFWGAGPNSPSVREGPGFVAQMPHAHNGYIDITLQTGFIGLAIFATLMISALHATGRVARTRPGLAGFALSLLVFGLLYNTLESAWFRSFSLDAMTFVLAVVLVSQRQEQQP